MMTSSGSQGTSIIAETTMAFCSSDILGAARGRRRGGGDGTSGPSL